MQIRERLDKGEQISHPFLSPSSLAINSSSSLSHFLSLALAAKKPRRRGAKDLLRRVTGKVCQLLVFLFSAFPPLHPPPPLLVVFPLTLSNSIQLLGGFFSSQFGLVVDDREGGKNHHFALDFGGKASNLGFLCTFFQFLSLSLSVSSVYRTIRPGRFSSLYIGFLSHLIVPLDWSIKKGKEGRKDHKCSSPSCYMHTKPHPCPSLTGDKWKKKHICSVP